MKKVIAYIDVDLTKIKKLSGELIPDTPIELRLIELYSYNNRTDIFNSFATIVLQDIYMFTDIKDPIKHITKFFKYKVFLSIVNKFINYIEILVLKEIKDDKINILNITYDSVIIDTLGIQDMFVVRFKIDKVEHE